MLFEVRNNPQNLSHERVKTLRIASNIRLLLARAAVAGGDIHDSPLGIAGPGGWIENQITHRMNAPVVLETHHLAGRAFKRGIGNVRVGPFDDYRFPLRLAKGADRGSHRVARRFESWKIFVIGKIGSR